MRSSKSIRLTQLTHARYLRTSQMYRTIEQRTSRMFDPRHWSRSELDVQFLDLLRLEWCRLYPFGQVAPGPDMCAICGADRVKLNVVAAEAGHHRGIHHIADRWFPAKQPWASPGFQALAPDRRDPVDVGLRGRPDG